MVARNGQLLNLSKRSILSSLTKLKKYIYLELKTEREFSRLKQYKSNAKLARTGSKWSVSSYDLKKRIRNAEKRSPIGSYFLYTSFVLLLYGAPSVAKFDISRPITTHDNKDMKQVEIDRNK